MENFDVSNVTDNSKEQLLDKVEDLEIQSEELLNQVEKLEGIRGALEEKVSAYRYRLKEVTRQMEDIDSARDIVVYHNKDNLDRRRFVLRKKADQCCSSTREAAANNELQDRYERLLEQYMYEHDRNEKLFEYLFQKEGKGDLELFVKADAADTLLDATTFSRKIIQQAEEQAREIGLDLREQLNRFLKQERNLPQETISEVKDGIRCLEK